MPVLRIAAAVVDRIPAGCSQTLAEAAAETDRIAAAGRVVADPDRPPEEQSQAEAAACRRSRLRGSQMSCGGQYGERASVRQIPHTCQERRWRRGLGHRESAVLPRLRSQQSFGFCSMPFSSCIFLEGVLHVDGFVHEELAVHALYRLVGCFEAVVRDEAEAFAGSGCFVSLYLGWLYERSELAKSCPEHSLIHIDVEIAHKEVGADVNLLLVRGCLQKWMRKRASVPGV